MQTRAALQGSLGRRAEMNGAEKRVKTLELCDMVPVQRKGRG